MAMFRFVRLNCRAVEKRLLSRISSVVQRSDRVAGWKIDCAFERSILLESMHVADCIRCRVSSSSGHRFWLIIVSYSSFLLHHYFVYRYVNRKILVILKHLASRMVFVENCLHLLLLFFVGFNY